MAQICAGLLQQALQAHKTGEKQAAEEKLAEADAYAAQMEAAAFSARIATLRTRATLHTRTKEYPDAIACLSAAMKLCDQASAEFGEFDAWRHRLIRRQAYIQATFEAAKAVFSNHYDPPYNPDEYTTNILIFKSGSLVEGLRLLAEMKDAGLAPNVVTYSSLIALAKRNYRAARQFYMDMQRQRIPPDAVILTNMIDAADTFKDAYPYLGELLRRELRVDTFVLFALMRKTSNYAQNRNIVERAQSHFKTRPNVFMYTRLINLAPDATRAAADYEEMRGQGGVGNHRTAEALRRHGLWELIERDFPLG